MCGAGDDAHQLAAAQHRPAGIAEAGAGADVAGTRGSTSTLSPAFTRCASWRRPKLSAPALVGGAVAGDDEAIAGAFTDRRRGDSRGQWRRKMQNGGIVTLTRRPSSSTALRGALAAPQERPPASTRMPRATMGGGDGRAARDHHTAAVTGADQADDVPCTTAPAGGAASIAAAHAITAVAHRRGMPRSPTPRQA